MKVYRFMSKWEFDYMIQGGIIVGCKSYKARTNSSGVCFFPEYLDASNGEYYWSIFPWEYHCFFKGCSRREYNVLVEFEADPSIFTEAYGVYADPEGDYYDRMVVNELNIPRYSRDVIKPLRYSVPDEFGECGIEWWEVMS